MISFGNTLTVCVSRMRPLERSVCRTHSGHDLGSVGLKLRQVSCRRVSGSA